VVVDPASRLSLARPVDDHVGLVTGDEHLLFAHGDNNFGIAAPALGQ
jgi:hypothetical protein